jgi:UDP-N-acetylglucosamine 2-epimerase
LRQLHRSTERPVTRSEGTNRLVDPDDEAAVAAAKEAVLEAPGPGRGAPSAGDGRAGDRIVVVVADWLQSRGPGWRSTAGAW